MGLTEEIISTLAMIYSVLLIRVLSVPILSLATLSSRSRTGIVLSVLVGRTGRTGRSRRTGSRRAFVAAGHIFENGSSEQGRRDAHDKIYCEQLRVQTCPHSFFGWLRVRRRIGWLHRISWQQRPA
jgi:hypothetical protein